MQPGKRSEHHPRPGKYYKNKGKWKDIQDANFNSMEGTVIQAGHGIVDPVTLELPRPMKLFWSFVGFAALGLGVARAEEKERPLMRDFMGLNGHTVQFKPDLYAPVARMIRDYHPMHWDLGKDTSFPTTFPSARNKVDWSTVYGSWVKAGLHVNASLMFDDFAPGDWRNISRDAAVYGEEFACAFGSSSRALVESAEIGNEPGKYSDAEYRRLFEAMAGGSNT